MKSLPYHFAFLYKLYPPFFPKGAKMGEPLAVVMAIASATQLIDFTTEWLD